jgi:FixJ family two-component response regulator
MSGTDLVKKANAGGCRSPVLVLTTLPDEDMDWALDDAGAAGHVNKHLDFHERTLRNAIRTAIKHNKDVTEVREQLRELQRQVAELIQAFERRT